MCVRSSHQGTANRPRCDEVTGFTRCSVLKVRADAAVPHADGVWPRAGAAPTGDASSLPSTVNLAIEREPPSVLGVLPPGEPREPPAPDRPDGSLVLAGGFALEVDILVSLLLPIHPDASLREEAASLGPAADEVERLEQRRDVDHPVAVVVLPEDGD